VKEYSVSLVDLNFDLTEGPSSWHQLEPYETRPYWQPSKDGPAMVKVVVGIGEDRNMAAKTEENTSGLDGWLTPRRLGVGAGPYRGIVGEWEAAPMVLKGDVLDTLAREVDRMTPIW